MRFPISKAVATTMPKKVEAVRSRADVDFLDDDQIIEAGEAACDNPDLSLDDVRAAVIDELQITVNGETTTVLLDVFCDAEPNA